MDLYCLRFFMCHDPYADSTHVSISSKTEVNRPIISFRTNFINVRLAQSQRTRRNCHSRGRKVRHRKMCT